MSGVFLESAKNIRDFSDILHEVQEYISGKYAILISHDSEKQKEQMKYYITKYLMDYSLAVEDMNLDELVETLYSEMAEYSFLTKYLFRSDIEEININAWNDIKVTYSNGEILPIKETFNSPRHAIDVIRRLLHKSGMIIDQSQPIVVGHLSERIRITVLGQGVIDPAIGVAVSIRIVNPDYICVAEMKSEEAFFAQESARTGHGVTTTIHASSCIATYYRMVTLCKQRYDMDERTLYNLVTEAFPIVAFSKKLEDNSRHIMEITECEIKEDGSRAIRTLYKFNVMDNAFVDGKLKIIGEYEKVNDISSSLEKRLLENGMPSNLLERFKGGGKHE
jgi:Flp pilus assembly CpaF family ATPase